MTGTLWVCFKNSYRPNSQRRW